MSWSADLDVYIWMGGNGWLNQHLFNVLPHEGVSKWFLYHALKVGMPRFRRHEGIWALPPPYWDGETGRRAIRNLWRVPGK